jgi:hypothetical protein
VLDLFLAARYDLHGRPPPRLREIQDLDLGQFAEDKSVPTEVNQLKA